LVGVVTVPRSIYQMVGDNTNQREMVGDNTNQRELLSLQQSWNLLREGLFYPNLFFIGKGGRVIEQ
jgi:hypothetical protein